MNEQDFERIDGMIARHVGTFADSIQHKLDLVVEGHQMLFEKIDRVKTELEDKIGCVKTKLDAVAAQADRSDAKLNTVAEKLDSAAAKGEETAIKLDGVSAKLDALATDLKAHRANTEAPK